MFLFLNGGEEMFYMQVRIKPQGGGVASKKPCNSSISDMQRQTQCVSVLWTSHLMSGWVWQNILEVKREVRGQNGLFEQLHQVAVLCGRQVGEDVVTLWRHTHKRC